jgi:hypothetical protein
MIKSNHDGSHRTVRYGRARFDQASIRYPLKTTFIVLYALETDLLKQQAVWRILFQFPLISVQVLNACSNVLIKKKKLDNQNYHLAIKLKFIHGSYNP